MKILIVSPFFPPSASVAVVRISSLVRELIKSGHEITIIRNEYNNSHTLEPNSDPLLINLNTYTVKIDQSIRYFEASERYKNVFRRAMKNDNFDLVLITAGPYYTIPICEVAKKEYNTKCIIDYRDLWLFDMRKLIDIFNPISLAKKFIYFPIEKNIKYADLVVTVTEEWKQILQRVYRTEKIKVISNGYDDELLSKQDLYIDYPYKDRFVISVFGKLSYYSIEYGIKFFEAMKTLSEKYPELIILHIGSPEKETEEAIKASGFDNKKYINTGFIKYIDGIQLLKKTDVSVIIDIRKGAMGTKFYDYVYVNKPLVYLGKKHTQLDRLVEEFDNGFSCYSIDDLIKNIIRIRENNINLLTNAKSAQKYARSKQNKRYLELIEEL